MGTWIVSPKYQFANGAAYPVRTDEDVTFMGCLVRAVTELVTRARPGIPRHYGASAERPTAHEIKVRTFMSPSVPQLSGLWALRYIYIYIY